MFYFKNGCVRLINWKEIQSFYNNENTTKDVINRFGISYSMMSVAIELGLFKSRSLSESMILSLKKNPRTQTTETKEKLSRIRTLYLQNHPDKVPYKLNHYSKGPSYPEQYFNTVLLNCLLDFERYIQVSLYNLDFVFRNQMIDLEIDGDQHYLDKRIIQSNKRRDEYLQSCGWRVIRVRWSDFQKLSDTSRHAFVDDLVKEITN